jgi:dGTPase
LEDVRRGAELVRELIAHMIGAVFAEAEKNLAAVKPQSTQDVREQSKALIGFPPGVAAEEAAIKAFLYQHMYRHKRVVRVMEEAEQILFDLFARYQKEPHDLPPEWLAGAEADNEGDRARRIGNFIAGMTDRFALTEHQRLFDSTPDLR